MSTITPGELQELLASAQPPILIDVLPAEYFEYRHLPGAKNCCVYEVTFLDQVAAIAPDKETHIVVYGLQPHYLASDTACEKLSRAGYTRVRDFRGGLAQWEAAGLPLEQQGGSPPSAPALRIGRHTVDPAKSRVQWTGRNINGSHTGSLAIKSGSIEVAGSDLDHTASGEFLLDMDSIANSDLTDNTLKRILVAHLKSDDFFDVARFPTATFRMLHVIMNSHAIAGTVNADVTGSFALKDVTQDLGFPATIELLPGGALSAEAHFDIDRTRWNVLYGSGRFFEYLGRNMVHDIVSLSLHIVTD